MPALHSDFLKKNWEEHSLVQKDTKLLSKIALLNWNKYLNSRIKIEHLAKKQIIFLKSLSSTI